MSKLRKMFSKASKAELPKTEEKPSRTLAEIQAEYSNACFDIGQLEYKIFVFKNDIQLLLERTRNLNKEGAEAQQREALAAEQTKAAAPAASEEKKEENNG